jgi:hypothetical protein
MPGGLNGKQFKLKAAIVGADTYRAVECESFTANVSFPNGSSVDEDVQVASGHSCAQTMVFSLSQVRDR